MGSPAQSKASIKYNRSHDSITLRPDKETGKAIRDAASASGKSLQNFILDAIHEIMERDSERG